MSTIDDRFPCFLVSHACLSGGLAIWAGNFSLDLGSFRRAFKFALASFLLVAHGRALLALYSAAYWQRTWSVAARLIQP